MESHGYTVAVYNRTRARVDEFVAGRASGKKIIGCPSVQDLVAPSRSRAKIMIMVKAGAAVDQVIEEVAAHLEPGTSLSTAATRTTPTPPGGPRPCRPEAALHRHRCLRGEKGP